MITPNLHHELVGNILAEILKAANRGKPIGKAAAARIHAAFPTLTFAEVRAAISQVHADLQVKTDMILAERATKH